MQLVSEGWDIVEVETGQGKSGKEKDRWRLKRKGFTVSGRIDRIDRHRETGVIRIMDYKTIDAADTVPEKTHLTPRKDNTADYNIIDLSTVKKDGTPKKNERKWSDLQLPLYAMIYNQSNVYSDKIELGYFLLPKVASKTGYKPWPEFNDVRMQSAVECLDGVLDAVAGNVFWPPAESVTYDDFGDLFRMEGSVKEI